MFHERNDDCNRRFVVARIIQNGCAALVHATYACTTGHVVYYIIARDLYGNMQPGILPEQIARKALFDVNGRHQTEFLGRFRGDAYTNHATHQEIREFGRMLHQNGGNVDDPVLPRRDRSPTRLLPPKGDEASKKDFKSGRC